MIRAFFLSLLLGGCSGSPSSSSFTLQEVKGRNDQAVYHLSIPNDWQRIETTGDLKDTMQPLCSWQVETAHGSILMTFHNFPIRIPPQAQIERWRRQFTHLDPTGYITTPQAFSGFVGWRFEATGLQKNGEVSVVAWTMQLASEHGRHLQMYEEILTPAQREYLDQMRADFTLKAIGPPAALEQRRQEIIAVGRSIELIQDLLNEDH